MFLIGHLKTRHFLVLMKFHMTVLYELRALFFSMIKPEKHPGMLGITTRTEKAVKSNEHFLIAFCFSLIAVLRKNGHICTRKMFEFYTKICIFSMLCLSNIGDKNGCLIENVSPHNIWNQLVCPLCMSDLWFQILLGVSLRDSAL